MHTLGVIGCLSKFNSLPRHRKTRRGLSTIVTSAILLSAVSVLGVGIIGWANTNLSTHQAELDEMFATNHNKINERITIEHVWFGAPASGIKYINITMSNTGTLGLNVTSIKIQNIDSGQYQIFTHTNGGIGYASDISFNETMDNPAWIADTPYDILIETNRGNLFNTEVLSP